MCLSGMMVRAVYDVYHHISRLMRDVWSDGSPTETASDECDAAEDMWCRNGGGPVPDSNYVIAVSDADNHVEWEHDSWESQSSDDENQEVSVRDT